MVQEVAYIFYSSETTLQIVYFALKTDEVTTRVYKRNTNNYISGAVMHRAPGKLLAKIYILGSGIITIQQL